MIGSNLNALINTHTYTLNHAYFNSVISRVTIYLCAKKHIKTKQPYTKVFNFNSDQLERMVRFLILFPQAEMKCPQKH